ncbi:MAG: ABC transporter permease [Nibricoccus sp.]
MKQLVKKLAAFFNRRRLDDDMHEEMREHLQRRTEANIAAGMSPDEARYEAQRQFGGMDQLKEQAREQRSWATMDTLFRDFRFASRSLRKAPGFTATTILILTLGIGGVTAMFSTLYAVMIRPLPYPNAERLVMGRATFGGEINPMAAGPDYIDYRDQSHSFAAFEAFYWVNEVTVRHGTKAERASTLIVSTGLFNALGAPAAIGRNFTLEDSKAESLPVVMVSHDYWQRHYGDRNDVTNVTLWVDGVSRTVVGVTPPDFNFIYNADLWLPQTSQNLGPRRYNNWLMLGRLKDGVSLAEAQSDVDVIAANLATAYPDTHTTRGLLLTPLQEAFAERHRMSFLMLCGGAAAILLIACANAAGLLLARGAAREGELAVRAALGASKWQIVRLLLAEALLLAVTAGVLGTLLAVWAQDGLMRLFSIETLFLRNPGISWPVLSFVLLATVTTALGVGLIPILRAKRPDLARAMKMVGKGSSRQGKRLRGGLVAAQLGTSFILLVVAGMLARSLSSLHTTDPGFDPRNLLTVEVPLPRDYTQARTQFFESLLEEIRKLPGVRAAGAISQLPLRNPSNDISLYDASSPPATPAEGGHGYQRVVLPGYFEAMGIPLLAGRDIRASDTTKSTRVIVISKVLAERLFNGRNPLGRTVIVDGVVNMPWEVVGVVADVKASDLRGGGDFARCSLPAARQMVNRRCAWRSAPRPIRGTIVPSLRALLHKLDPQIPLSGPRTMEEVMANTTLSEKAQHSA